MKRIYVGELEHQIYEMIKVRGEVTVREIYQTLERKSKYTTVLTVMDRMYKKGELDRRKNGIRFVYFLKEGKSKGHDILVKIKDSLFQGRAGNMVSYLLKEEKLDQKELSEIEEMIHAMKEGKK